jgi:hypothetical protein
MRDALIEVVVEVSMFLLYAVATAILAGIGTILEYRSYLSMNSGETVMALYAAGLGIVLLTFAYRVGRDKVTDAWTEMRAELF